MLGGWGQPARKAPHVSNTLERGEWRVVGLGGTRPRPGVDVQGAWTHLGQKRQQKAVKDGEKALMIQVWVRWRSMFLKQPLQGQGAPHPVGHHIAQNLGFRLPGVQDCPRSPAITCRVLETKNLRPTPDLLSANLWFYKIPRRFRNTLKCEKHWFRRNTPNTCSLTHPDYVCLHIKFAPWVADFPRTCHQEEEAPDRAG